jgi:RNA polymerase sigma-70 factor (ECF subfamily)
MPASNWHLMSDDQPPTVPDDDLLPRIADGDRSAFTALFRRRHADVYRFALHMTGQPAVADDVTQEVFLTVMRDAHRYQVGRSTVGAWLCGIARNLARRRLDLEHRHQPLGEGEVADQRVTPVTPDPAGDLDRAERIERLRAAILKLPLRYREALVLCDLQEMSYADAAVALDCAVGTVRSRLHRARALLAARLRASDDTRRQTTGIAARARGTRCFV